MIAVPALLVSISAELDAAVDVLAGEGPARASLDVADAWGLVAAPSFSPASLEGVHAPATQSTAIPNRRIPRVYRARGGLSTAGAARRWSVIADPDPDSMRW